MPMSHGDQVCLSGVEMHPGFSGSGPSEILWSSRVGFCMKMGWAFPGFFGLLKEKEVGPGLSFGLFVHL